MVRLRYGYLISGILIGLILLINGVQTFPDGNLHIIFCDVGQGDSAYIRFPDGHDMLIDGGPNDSVVGCLSRHMPFWDRTIDLVAMSHPQKDHIGGLISVFGRYRIGSFIHGETIEQSDSWSSLEAMANNAHVAVRTGRVGEKIVVGGAAVHILSSPGVSTNDKSLCMLVSYGTFDALFTGDAPILDAIAGVEVIKVPHHGSKTEFIRSIVTEMRPKIAVISVGKNSFGHPAPDVLGAYTDAGASVYRTDTDGDIEIVSDGHSMWRAD